ncbi:TPA: Ig-like domain-containing protein, partial [Yersinia enterocolitica]
MSNSSDTNIRALPANLASTVYSNGAQADGTSENIIIYTLTDALGLPVQDILLFSTPSPTARLQPQLDTTNTAGQLILRVTNTTSGPVTVNASVFSNSQITNANSVTFGTQSTVLIAETITDDAPADGQSLNRILYTLKNSQTNAVLPNIVLDIENHYGAKPEAWAPITDQNGHALLELSNTQPGRVVVDARTLDNSAMIS